MTQDRCWRDMVMKLGAQGVRFFTCSLPEWPFEFTKEALVLAPFLVNADVEVEEDLRAEDRLQLDASLGADLLDHRPLLADHDRFLRLPLDDDRGENLDKVST